MQKFKLLGNKLNKPTFGGKGRYIIPVTIIKNFSNYEYQISILFNYQKLKKDNIYYEDYSLLKFCNNQTWKELLNQYIK